MKKQGNVPKQLQSRTRDTSDMRTHLYDGGFISGGLSLISTARPHFKSTDNMPGKHSHTAAVSLKKQGAATIEIESKAESHCNVIPLNILGNASTQTRGMAGGHAQIDSSTAQSGALRTKRHSHETATPPCRGCKIGQGDSDISLPITTRGILCNNWIFNLVPVHMLRRVTSTYTRWHKCYI